MVLLREPEAWRRRNPMCIGQARSSQEIQIQTERTFLQTDDLHHEYLLSQNTTVAEAR